MYSGSDGSSSTSVRMLPIPVNWLGRVPPATMSHNANIQTDDSLSDGRAGFPIVGVGASAGGLDAFRQLLRNLPPNTGMGFVYIQHLDATHTSILADIFARETSMRVSEAKAGATVQPDQLYIIAPNTDLTIRAGVLAVTARVLPPGHHLPIDDFMRSLAEQHPSRGIAVVLSGASSDGALGLVAVKQSGGITFAQDDSAQHSTMPHHAINTGAVDFVLPPAEIGAELGRIAHDPYFRRTRRDLARLIPEGDGTPFQQILKLVLTARKADFSAYRASTLKRRVARRMSVCRIERIEDYVSLLANNVAEIDALVNEMLIKVTSFFRDPDMFRTLADFVFGELAGSKKPNEEVRIWVPACATGEEAYSLAIALLEWRTAHSVDAPLRVFGTDLSQSAINHARRGMYVENIAMDVSPERLSRFFHHVEDHYQINKPVRDICVFAKHDITQDPPFSKMDLASCRNMLIYMSPPLQRSVLERLHYALNPGGILILGGSEAVLGHSDLFASIDKGQRVFRKLGASQSFRQPSEKSPSVFALKASSTKSPAEVAIQEVVERLSVARADHTGVVVDQEGRVLQFRGEVGRFLAPSHGSVNEEIETGKEELQSGNEELVTVNEQMHASNVSLNQANADLRNLLASVAFPIVVLGPDLRIRMFTPSASEVFNLIQSDVGRDLGHIRSNLVMEDLTTAIRACCASGNAAEMEVADKAGNWYLMRINLSKDRETDTEGVILTLVNIGNRKRIEEEREKLLAQLRREQAQLAQLVEHMPSGLIVVDARSGQVVLTNRNTGKLLGASSIQIGQPASDIRLSGFRPDGTPYEENEWPLLRTLRTGEVVRDESIQIAASNSRRITVRVNTAPIRDASGEIALAMALFDEVTDVDALRRQLANTEQLAQSQRLETIGRLAGGVAHDFNNLLTVIIGFSQFVRDDETLTPPLASQMDTIIQAANRGATLTSQLLAFSRRQPIQPREIDLNLLVARVARMLERVVPANIDLRLELTPEPCVVLVDAGQIEQLVMNLVSNARDAIETQGEITVATGRMSQQSEAGATAWLASLSVSDNGRGMTEEIRAHIFEPFFTTKEFGRGTGLGLASVFGTVQQHNGDIRVESSPGVGTRIEVLLPCLPAKQEAQPPVSTGPVPGTETILLAEDEDGVRAMARRCLENIGYKVIEARDGEEALRLYREHPGVIDLLLTDVVMPRMNGGELMHRLRELQPGISVAFMSGYPQDVVGEHGRIGQDIHFLQKPFNIADLSIVVRRALDFGARRV
jgi:two-component system, chemotaxis family, CheB/CheR fusion protein